MSNLYQASSEINRLIAQLAQEADSDTGEISDDSIIEQIERLCEQEDYYLDELMLGIIEQEATAKAHKEVAKSFTERAKAIENSVDRQRQVIEKIMGSRGIDKLECDTMKASYRKSQATDCDEYLHMMNALLRTIALPAIITRFCKVELKASKTDIKNAIKAGEEINGATLRESKSLQIKPR